MNRNRMNRFPRPSQQYLNRNKKTSNDKQTHHNKSKIDIDNDKFDVTKLRLITATHRARFCLAFIENGRGNDLFYDQLSDGNMVAINTLLCHLWDIYHPNAINTNCGVRFWNQFHCKLIYDHHSYVHLLNTITPNDDQVLNNYIQHFKQHSSNYIQKHEIIELQFYQNDLKRYATHFKADRADCFPKTLSQTALKPNFCDRMVCGKNLLFDLNDTKRTVLYLEYNTNVDSTRFKMVDCASNVNVMMQDMLCVAGKLKLRTCKYKANLLNTAEDTHRREIKAMTAMFDWYKINLTTYQHITERHANTRSEDDSYDDEKERESGEHSYMHSVVVRVELHVSILNFIFFVAIYKQHWLQQAQNKMLFQQWFNSYCDYINGHCVDKCTESEINAKFNCRELFNHDACRVVLDWRQ